MCIFYFEMMWLFVFNCEIIFWIEIAFFFLDIKLVHELCFDLFGLA
jgi:hypothetical protein